MSTVRTTAHMSTNPQADACYHALQRLFSELQSIGSVVDAA